MLLQIFLKLFPNINELVYSQQSGNDIDLKPVGSRFMQKQSFTVHWGSDNTGDMLFMEVNQSTSFVTYVGGGGYQHWYPRARAFASCLGGYRFNTWPSQTKDFKLVVESLLSNVTERDIIRMCLWV